MNAPPLPTFEALAALYASMGEDILRQMLGEHQRLRDYPAKGWITDEPILDCVHAAAHALSTF